MTCKRHKSDQAKRKPSGNCIECWKKWMIEKLYERTGA
jgi:hypothetical protein